MLSCEALELPGIATREANHRIVGERELIAEAQPVPVVEEIAPEARTNRPASRPMNVAPAVRLRRALGRSRMADGR